METLKLNAIFIDTNVRENDSFILVIKQYLFTYKVTDVTKKVYYSLRIRNITLINLVKRDIRWM